MPNGIGAMTSAASGVAGALGGGGAATWLSALGGPVGLGIGAAMQFLPMLLRPKPHWEANPGATDAINWMQNTYLPAVQGMRQTNKKAGKLYSQVLKDPAGYYNKAFAPALANRTATLEENLRYDSNLPTEVASAQRNKAVRGLAEQDRANYMAAVPGMQFQAAGALNSDYKWKQGMINDWRHALAETSANQYQYVQG